MIQGLISGVVWFVLFLIVHIALFHRKHIQNSFPLIMRVFLGCLTGHAVTIQVTRGAIPAMYGLVAMACLFILYMPFYYITVASLSIQTLILLRDAVGQSLRITELRQHFASDAIVAGRLKTMVSNGYLIEEQDRYRVTSKGRLVARSFAALKEFWRLGPGG